MQILYLGLDNNRLTGTLPKTWFFPQAKYISLASNAFTGSIAGYWLNRSSSVSRPPLILSQTTMSIFALSNEFPSLIMLRHAPALQARVTRLDNNQFTGAIPPMSNGTLLCNLTSNRLTNMSTVGLPPSLKVLYLADNMFTGAIPEPDMLPTSLTILDVADNLLSAALPQALPANLTVLNASNNQLSGTLPAKWPSLAELRLDTNNLTGKLPNE